jgi:pimeloyl-ACP methyl ester carboxylesterase
VTANKHRGLKLVRSVEHVLSGDSYDESRLETREGSVVVRLYWASGARAGLLILGGSGSGFDSPAKGLYPKLARALQQDGLASLLVAFRDPIDLDHSTLDALAGIEFLGDRGIVRMALLGHAFGGAVAIQTALRSQAVLTVVTLSTQGFGTEGVEDLAPRSILLVHGTGDTVLPASCSVDAYQRAGEPKELKLIDGAGHRLDEATDQVYSIVYQWIMDRLNSGGPQE